MSDKKSVENLHECYCSGVQPTIAYKYLFLINEEEFEVGEQTILGDKLHELAGTSSETHFIRMKTANGKELIGPKTKVNLAACGIERFIIRPYNEQEVDLEKCFCEGMKPFITYQYLLKVNGTKYKTDKEQITGAEILRLAGKDPETHRLRMFTANGKRPVQLDEVIDLRECGVERFVAEPHQCTEGFINKEEFDLPVEDVKYLKGIGNTVELKRENQLRWVIIRNFSLPKGYNVDSVDVAFLIPPHYPTTQIDMFYFHPHLSRVDMQPINKISEQVIEGKRYQRWSRHRTNGSPWEPGVDNIKSHISLMEHCLLNEFKKR